MGDAQEEAEELVNAVLPHAEGMLIAHGEFFPFGGALTLDGELAELSVGDDYRHSPVEVIVEELKKGFRDGELTRDGNGGLPVLKCVTREQVIGFQLSTQ